VLVAASYTSQTFVIVGIYMSCDPVLAETSGYGICALQVLVESFPLMGALSGGHFGGLNFSFVGGQPLVKAATLYAGIAWSLKTNCSGFDWGKVRDRVGLSGRMEGEG
jgi:hypothetical protein